MVHNLIDMDKYFICLANSYKHGGRCVAGIEIAFDIKNKPIIVRHPDGRPCWIRPISNESDGSIPNEIARGIKLFSVVKLTDVVPCPHKAHVEDVKYSQMVCKYGYFTPNDDLMNLCLDKKHQNIFYFQGKAVSAQMVERLDYSLMFIHPENAQAYIDENKEKSKYRIKFNYYGSSYDFPITDPVFLEAFKAKPECSLELKNVYLTLSLGLEFEGFHYKLVAAVIQTEKTTNEIDNSSNQKDVEYVELEKEKSENWFEKFEKDLAYLIDRKKEIENQIAALRKELLQQMEIHGEEKVKSTRFSVSYIPPKTILQFDRDLFREENEELYRNYCTIFDSKLFKEENQELYVNYCKPKQKEASIIIRQNNAKE